MAIVKMKHLRLVAMAEDREAVLRLLQHMGCVEVDETALQKDGPDAEAWEQLKQQMTRLDTQGLSAAREEQSQAERALGVLKRSAPAKGGFLSPKPEVAEKELFDENAACHIAFGQGYPGTVKGGNSMTREQLRDCGVNESLVHEDVMVGSDDMTITGLTENGETVVIFENGEWAF